MAAKKAGAPPLPPPGPARMHHLAAVPAGLMAVSDAFSGDATPTVDPYDGGGAAAGAGSGSGSGSGSGGGASAHLDAAAAAAEAAAAEAAKSSKLFGASGLTRRASFAPRHTLSFGERSAEHRRLQQSEARKADWKKFGPYLSERAWGTVREDYSESGDAWSYFDHDQSRSRAYRWNEDGLAGVCNRYQNICMSVGLWNGRDPILKERLFGLTGSEGNHGEDVKEYYFYVDSTPTHSYMKLLYKYPMDEYPYGRLVTENAARSRLDREYELLDAMPDTWRKNEYFDVFVEYAKADEEDILCQITCANRSDTREAPIHVLPHVWFRNTWSWGYGRDKPNLKQATEDSVEGHESHIGDRFYYACAPSVSSGAAGAASSGGGGGGSDDDDGEEDPKAVETTPPHAFLFTENETNNRKLFGSDNASPYVKDAFHEYVVNGNAAAVNPALEGTKCAAHFSAMVPPGGTYTVWVRLSSKRNDAPFEDFSDVMKTRIGEADHYYSVLQDPHLSDDDKLIQRQALAGLLWSKQWYHYGVSMWMDGDPGMPPPPEARKTGRNAAWGHLYNADVISMPDKWEYPWYAAWDLSFHTLPLALVDPEWAKRQLILMLREWYMHPSGQIPAYEWNFSDVNPPVHAWACFRVFKITAASTGYKDLTFLERCFHKLMLNFTWWVNRKDAEGRNLFEGGFLGLDNIGVFDRSHELPEGMTLEQADGTAWMGFFCLTMLSIAVELAQVNRAYEDVCTKFFEHFVAISHSIGGAKGGVGLWDEEEKFFFDVLRPIDGDGTHGRRYVRAKSFVGLIPLFSVITLDEAKLARIPAFKRRMEWFERHRADEVGELITWMRPKERGRGSGSKSEAESAGGATNRRLLSLVSKSKLRHVLTRMLDEDQFLSKYGLRSLSKEHEAKPYNFEHGSMRASLRYDPGESSSPMYGGNSNWRGPIWMPTNYLMIESLQQYDYYFGDAFKIECPTGSGVEMSLWDVSQELSRRLASIFERNEAGERPVNDGNPMFNHDKHWSGLVTFFEFFHGDGGAGLGASHQTGWTALVAKMLQQLGSHATCANARTV